MAANVIKELVDTEENYVKKLSLLSEIFRGKVLIQNVISEELQNSLFDNLESLYNFHKFHLFPQLKEAANKWEHTRRISHVIKNLAPYLKMYSAYSTSYTKSMDTYKKAMKIPAFAAIVADIEKLPVCSSMHLQEHFICPVQRITKYELILKVVLASKGLQLLKEYQKSLSECDIDHEDTELAITLVWDAANHANETLKRWEGFQYLVEIQKELGDTISLVSDRRELKRKGGVKTAKWTGSNCGPVVIYLYTDLILLVCGKNEEEAPTAKNILAGADQLFVFYSLQTQLHITDDTSSPHSFCIRDHNKLKRYVQITCESQQEFQDWLEELSNVVYGTRTHQATVGCVTCKEKSCTHSLPNQRFNLNPILQRVPSLRRSQSFGTVRLFKSNSVNGVQRRQSLFSKKTEEHKITTIDECVLYAEWVQFEGERRYCKVKDDCSLYVYKDLKDSVPYLKLSLPGCKLKIGDLASSFTLSLKDTTFTIRCKDMEDMRNLLDMIANAQFHVSS